MFMAIPGSTWKLVNTVPTALAAMALVPKVVITLTTTTFPSWNRPFSTLKGIPT